MLAPFILVWTTYEPLGKRPAGERDARESGIETGPAAIAPSKAATFRPVMEKQSKAKRPPRFAVNRTLRARFYHANFRTTQRAAPITVLLTPEKVPVLLFTKEKSKEKIVVAMKSSEFAEFGDAEFAFQVTGVRDGFENEAVIVDADKVNAEPDQKAVNNPVKKRISALIEKAKADMASKKQK